jgi:ribosomal protein S18 acetylase RimI-like enzyme
VVFVLVQLTWLAVGFAADLGRAEQTAALIRANRNSRVMAFKALYQVTPANWNVASVQIAITDFLFFQCPGCTPWENYSVSRLAGEILSRAEITEPTVQLMILSGAEKAKDLSQAAEAIAILGASREFKDPSIGERLVSMLYRPSRLFS